VVQGGRDGLDQGQLRPRAGQDRKRAELWHFTWHNLRHTFASHLVAEGVPLKAVQELLGHTDIRLTMRYAHLAPSATRTAVQVLDHLAYGNLRQRSRSARWCF